MNGRAILRKQGIFGDEMRRRLGKKATVKKMSLAKAPKEVQEAVLKAMKKKETDAKPSGFVQGFLNRFKRREKAI